MVVSKYDIPWHRMPSLVIRNIGRNGGGPGFVFCFNCIFPRFLITVLCPLILMSSQQGAQTWITAEGKNSQTSFAKKYENSIFKIFNGKSEIRMMRINHCFIQRYRSQIKILSNIYNVLTPYIKQINHFHVPKGLMIIVGENK